MWFLSIKVCICYCGRKKQTIGLQSPTESSNRRATKLARPLTIMESQGGHVFLSGYVDMNIKRDSDAVKGDEKNCHGYASDSAAGIIETGDSFWFNFDNFVENRDERSNGGEFNEFDNNGKREDIDSGLPVTTPRAHVISQQIPSTYPKKTVVQKWETIIRANHGIENFGKRTQFEEIDEANSSSHLSRPVGVLTSNSRKSTPTRVCRSVGLSDITNSLNTPSSTTQLLRSDCDDMKSQSNTKGITNPQGSFVNDFKSPSTNLTSKDAASTTNESKSTRARRSFGLSDFVEGLNTPSANRTNRKGVIEGFDTPSATITDKKGRIETSKVILPDRIFREKGARHTTNLRCHSYTHDSPVRDIVDSIDSNKKFEKLLGMWNHRVVEGDQIPKKSVQDSSFRDTTSSPIHRNNPDHGKFDSWVDYEKFVKDSAIRKTTSRPIHRNNPDHVKFDPRVDSEKFVKDSASRDTTSSLIYRNNPDHVKFDRLVDSGKFVKGSTIRNATSSRIHRIHRNNPDHVKFDRLVDSEKYEGRKKLDTNNKKPVRALVILEHPNKCDLLIGEARRSNKGEDLLVIKNMNMKTDVIECECSRSVFSGKDDLISFFLPRMGMACVCGHKRLVNPEDPTLLENILRSWQVEFLNSFGIRRGEEFVKAKHRSAGIMARAMRQWRKKHGMTSFKTSACATALHIWSKICKSYVRSIRSQIRAGNKAFEYGPPDEALFNEMSHFLNDLPAAPKRRDTISNDFEPESQVEV